MSNVHDPDKDASVNSFGLSVRDRALIVLFSTFFIAVLALGISAIRTSRSADSVQLFVDAQATSDSGRVLETELWRVESTLWRFERSADTESARAVQDALIRVTTATINAEAKVVELSRHPSAQREISEWKDAVSGKLIDGAAPLQSMRVSLGRLRSLLSDILESPDTFRRGGGTDAMRKSHFLVGSLSKDAALLASQAQELVEKRASLAEKQVSNVSRDQLVLLLMVLFLLPVASWLGARWIARPLGALRVLLRQIAANRVREIDVRGSGEVARVARELQSVLTKFNANEKRQREKIFEMRRILRAIIDPVTDGVLILGKAGKIDYANSGVAHFLAKEVHQLETTKFEENLFSPALTDAVARAWDADVEQMGVDVQIEAHDGRISKVHAQLRSVRDQQGRITRVVLVMTEC